MTKITTLQPGHTDLRHLKYLIQLQTTLKLQPGLGSFTASGQ